MLANAARVAPDTVAVTLDDDALTFGEIDEQANRIANGLRELWVGRGDRVLWWGDTSLEAVPVFAALAKIGAVFAPLNARASLDEVAPVAEYARPRLLLCGASHVEAGAELATRVDVPFAPEIPQRRRRRARRHRSRRARSARHLLHERQHRAAEGRRAVAPHELAAHLRRRDDDRGRRRDRLHVPAVPHGGLDDRARRVAGPATGALRAHPRRGDAVAHDRPSPRGPAVLHPRGLVPHPRTRRRQRRSLESRGGRHRHVGDTARTAARDQGRAPPHPDPRVLRLDRSRAGRATRRRRSVPQTGQRRCRAARRRGAARRERRGARCGARS